MENIKLLVCDDSALSRRRMINFLADLGYTDVYEASNGIEAVSLYKEQNPDGVFLDIVMPGKDGIEVVKDIIAYDPSAKIIMVSSVGTQTNLKTALEEGACDFIQKPASLEDLDGIINRVIRG
jgi:two-component system chemotaxis response regulator CheY